MVDLNDKPPIWRVAQNALLAYKQAAEAQNKRKKLEEKLKEKIEKVEAFETNARPLPDLD